MFSCLASNVAQRLSSPCPLPCLQSGQKSRASICIDWTVAFPTAAGVMRIEVFRSLCSPDGVDLCFAHAVLCMVDGARRPCNAFGYIPYGRRSVQFGGQARDSFSFNLRLLDGDDRNPMWHGNFVTHAGHRVLGWPPGVPMGLCTIPCANRLISFPCSCLRMNSGTCSVFSCYG